MNTSPLIAIEGIDGSGKGTQAHRLNDRLNAAGYKSTLLSFPQYEKTFFGRAIGDFLNGRFGKLDEVNPYLASVLYAGDRFETRQLLTESLQLHDVVILDRYVPSNMAHQGAKCSADERAKLCEWVEELEHDVFGLPRADMVMFLDVPVEHASQWILKKKQRNYTDKKADLQEEDNDYLTQVHAAYQDLASQNSNWQRIQCVEEGEPRTIENISDELFSIVTKQVATNK